MISDATLRSREAFADMTRRCYGRVYFTALAIVRHADMAEDIAQETFLRAWLKRDTVKEPALLLLPWLLRIATNLSLQWMRTGQQRSRLLPLVPMEEMTVEPVDDTQPDPREAAGMAEQRGQVNELLATLPIELRHVILLHYVEGLSPSDIARMNGEHCSTVTRRLEKAREQLRQQWEQGLASGLALLKPPYSSAGKPLSLIVAVSALPAATRAQLLDLAADTVAPTLPSFAQPIGDPVATESSQLLQSLFPSGGAVKIAIAIAAVAAGVGAVYKLKSHLDISSKVHAIPAETKAGRITPSTSPVVHRATNNTGLTTLVKAQTEPAGVSHPRANASGSFIDDETIHFALSVVNDAGNPVQGASIKPLGIRATAEPSAWFGWGADPPTWVTSSDGTVQGQVRKYAHEKLETGSVVFLTTHPDYASAYCDMRLTSITQVVLTPGHSLDVIPIDEGSSLPITGEISTEFVDRHGLSPKWDRQLDGSISIRNISEKGTSFFLKHKPSTGTAVLMSDFHSITFPRELEGPLQVVLRPTHTVYGRLSDNVPRPVTNGKVSAYVATGRYGFGRYGKSTVDIASDGTFELTDMPEGTVHIWALVDGYCSVHRSKVRPFQDTQQFEMRTSNMECVLQMEPTATMKFRLLDAEGKPVVGAEAGAAPNIGTEGGNGIWFNQQFSGVSDGAGIATIGNIPAGTCFYDISGGWEIKPYKSDDVFQKVVRRDLSYHLEPGEVREKKVTVYPKGTFVITDEE